MEIKGELLAYVLERLPKPGERDRLEEISKGAGVPYHTLLKIVTGETRDPKVSTIDNLLRYFRTREASPA
jgi:predicted transcriptional regulator